MQENLCSKILLPQIRPLAVAYSEIILTQPEEAFLEM